MRTYIIPISWSKARVPTELICGIRLLRVEHLDTKLDKVKCDISVTSEDIAP